MVRRILWLFTIAGTLLLAGITAGLLSADNHIRIPAITALVTLAAVILSYLGGLEGGMALRDEAGNEGTRATALGLSNLPALAAWGVLWLPSPQWQVGSSIALFVGVWACDLWLARRGLIPAWFVDLRTVVTAAVCAILGVAFYLL